MTNIFIYLGEFIIKRRIVIVSAALIITVGMFFAIRLLTVDSDPDNILPVENTDFKFRQDLAKEFGAHHTIALCVTSKDGIYNASSLHLIKEATTFFLNLEQIDSKSEVLSLFTFNEMTCVDGKFSVIPLIEESFDFSPNNLNDLQQRIRANPLINGHLVSEDGKTAMIVAMFSHEEAHDIKKLRPLVKEFYTMVKKLEKKYSGHTISVAGTVLSEVKSEEYMNKDMGSLFPGAILVVLLLLLLILRSFSGMILPLMVVIFSVIWTFGIKGLVGSPLTMAEIMMPVMLIAIGCTDGVHIISEFLYLRRTKVIDAKSAVKRTISTLGFPVILTSLTTSFGFLSLITAPGVSFRMMGLFLAIGVICAMLISLIFLPAILSFSGSYRLEKKVSYGNKSLFEKTLRLYSSNLIRYVGKNKFVMILVIIFLTGIALFGAFNVKVECNPDSYFHNSDPIYKGARLIEKSMGGVYELYVVVQGNSGSLKDHTVISEISKFQDYAISLEQVGNSISYVDYLKQINRHLQGEDEIDKETDVSGLVETYRKGGGLSLTHFVNSDYSTAIVKLRLKKGNREEIGKLVKTLEAYITKHISKEIKTRFSNYYVYMIVSDSVVDSQIKSIIVSFITIFILLSVLFRSPLSALIVSLPTLCAIFINFFIMWLFNIKLDLATSTIAAIGFGVGIDYSIHIYSRFINFMKMTDDYEESVQQSIIHNTKAILVNAVAVGVGFLVLAVSKFKVIFNMGIIISLSMLSTSLLALTLLPALILIIRPRVQLTYKALKKD